MVNTNVFRGIKINAVFSCQFLFLSITILSVNTVERYFYRRLVTGILNFVLCLCFGLTARDDDQVEYLWINC